MKTATLPPIPVEPELLHEIEAVLGDSETISAFVVDAIRGAVAYRRVQAVFLARGESAWLEYQRTGESRPADEVLDRLEERILARRRELGDTTGR